jgi:hypothetical protein
VLADDLKQSLIGKSLFMKPKRGWRVDACQDGRLAGSALRSPRYAETRIRAHERAVEDNQRLFILKNSERRSIAEPVERIKGAARADAQTVNEEEKHPRHVRDE